MPAQNDPETLARGLRAGNRRALARTITLIESTRADQRAQARAVLEQAAADAEAGSPETMRLGITGVPGVGKSTFIESFGTALIEQGHKVAILAVDPSSARSGGSILGDKTRMEHLARNPDAFIRPSPTGGNLGGVARRTRESILACEAAGYDVVIVETVGVGQSETAVADMVDAFLLLLLPGGGDELQGIKRGIVELADIVIVNKADGAMTAAANEATSEYRRALTFLRGRQDGWKVPVLQCSALEERGLDRVWESVAAFREARISAGLFHKNRERQALSWMWSEIRDTLLERFRADAGVRARLAEIEQAVADGTITPSGAADTLLGTFLKDAPAPASGPETPGSGG
ncbi:methylmalonyl Co-A mutase-associated GTPase MeaB [Fodinicurvata sp. EGI_FJ10296]|uniref:methylmalonyl Co-A mutase-associated GTPase MeaB n=1 Tax=Fodinicurvata sp. EGI_FJ10296 TaxID=3231908 RepID=UPI003455E8D7